MAKTEMFKIFIILIVISILSIFAITFLAEQKSNCVGCDKDTHGCIGSAGYSWCEAKQKCIRVWEENCTITACTMEAKMCPDGSVVGRVGPDCEFAPCP